MHGNGLVMIAALGAALAAGGAATAGDCPPPATVFTDTGDDTTARFFHRAGRLASGHVLVSGGMRLQFVPPSLISLAELSFYDPDSGSFSTSFTPTGGGDPVTPVLATSRSSHTQTILLDDRVLITGGDTGADGTDPGDPVASVELFDPVTGVVSGGPPMAAARSGHSASRLPDGRVVVAGGGSSWQVFDPSDDSWSPSQTLQRSRTDHAAIVLPDLEGADEHRVLLVGGAGSGPDTLELLDPGTGDSVLLGATLDVGVDDLAATRLLGSVILIVGGQNTTNGDTIANSYLYDAAGDSIYSIDPPPARPDGLADHQIVRSTRYAIVLGGEQQVAGEDTALEYVAIFDAMRFEWLGTAAMNNPHDDFAAVSLDDDEVLIIDGGVDFLDGELPTSNVEVLELAGVETADIDCDGVVNVTDLLALLGTWGVCPPLPEACRTDLNGDRTVDVADLLFLLGSWG
jgi:hypothetical protein